MGKFIKNKKVIIIVGAIIALVCIIVVFSSSGNIYGAWKVAERSINENLDVYPEEIVIYENGHFTGDDFAGMYSINDDLITFSAFILGSFTYEYNVSGNTLTLRNIDNEDEPKIYYERVS